MAKDSDSSDLVLTDSNFTNWEFQLDELCFRKKATTSQEKFSYLVATLKDPNHLAMAREVKALESSKETPTPYEATISALKNLIMFKGLKPGSLELQSMIEKKKIELEHLRFGPGSYDLQPFIATFTKKLEEVTALGFTYDKKYLVKIFADAVLDHPSISAKAINVEYYVASGMSDYKTFALSLQHDLEKAEQRLKLNGSGNAKVLLGNNRWCDHCNKAGHTRASCFSLNPALKADYERRRKAKASKKPDDDPGEVPKGVGEKPARVLVATGLLGQSPNKSANCLCSFGSPTPSLRIPVLLDTCVSYHMTGVRSALKDYRPYGPNEITEIGGGPVGSSSPVLGSGTLCLELNDGNGNRCHIDIPDVKYADNFHKFIILEPELLYKTYGILYKIDTQEIRDSSGVLICPVIRDNSNGTGLPQVEHCFVRTQSIVLALSPTLWHQRFAHANNAYLDVMQKNQVVENFHMSNTPKQDICTACMAGHAKNHSFNRKEAPQVYAFLEVVSFDIDEMPVVSVEQYKYRLDVLDHGTNYVFVFGLKKKSDAYQHIETLVHLSKGSMKEMRTDGAKELFQVQSMKELCHSNGIILKRCEPHAESHYSLKVEHAHYVIDSKVRSLLYHAGLPKTLWYLASEYVAHTHNRTVTKVLNLERTPYEARFGRKPDVSHLRVFGSTVYYRRAKVQRDKLDPLIGTAIFLGYSEDSPGYKLYDVESGIMFTSDRIENVIETEFLGHEMVDQFGASMLFTANDVSGDDDYALDLDNVSDDDVPFIEYDFGDHLDYTNSEGSFQSIDPLSQSDDDSAADHDGVNAADFAPPPAVRMDTDSDSEPERKDYWNAPPQPRNRPSYKSLVASDALTSWNYKQARASSEWPEFKDAMKSFLNDLKDLNAYEYVKISDIGLSRPINSRWVFTKKHDAAGNFVTHKARLTPLGYEQVEGQDFGNIFAPVVIPTSVRLLFVLSLKLRRKVKSGDVKNAFQLARLEHDVYMAIPKGCEEVDPHMDPNIYCWKLVHSLNGLRQSAHEFFKLLKTHLLDMGLQPSKFDPCLFVLRQGNDTLYVGFHVDDFVYLGTSDTIERAFFAAINKRMACKGGTICEAFLQVRIQQRDGCVEFDQETKIVSYCSDLKITSPSTSFPQVNLAEIQEDTAIADVKLYQKALGCVVYLANNTRPDIATAVSQLSTCNIKPSVRAWRYLVQLLQYLLGTKHLKLKYTNSSTAPVSVRLVTDASYSAEPSLGKGAPVLKSRAGFLIFVDGCLIQWYSKRTTLSAQSTDLFLEVGIPTQCPDVYVDNTAAISWITNPQSSMRNRHFNIKLYHIRDMFDADMINISYIETSQNCADVMTKILGKNKFSDFRMQLGLGGSNGNSVK